MMTAKNNAAPKFVRLWSAEHKESILVRPSEVSQYATPGYSDVYGSLSYYDQNHEQEFQKTKSVSGIRGLKTDKIWFDLDIKGDLEKCRQSTLELIDRIVAKGFDENSLDIYFSGQKGFHVIMNLDSEIMTSKVKDIAVKFAKDIDGFDLSVYDEARILRLPFTRHSKTGLYKIPLTAEELKTFSAEQIKLAASQTPVPKNDPKKFVTIPEELMTADVPAKKKETVANFLEVRPDDKLMFSALDFTRKPRDWKSDAKYALSQGRFDIGDRHKAMMILGATCKALNYNELQTRGWMEAANTLHCEITGDSQDTDEIDKTLESVFSENWKGGQYSRANDPWLDNYCIVHGLDDERNDSEPINIIDINESFKNFVVNIDKNTIKTGIPELDDSVPITIGMNLGIIGAASSGKCLGKDTPIRMFDGSIKLVQNVIIGDLLMGDDSTPRTVLSTCKGREKLYRIEQEYGNSYVVNESHILSLKCNYERINTKPSGKSYPSSTLRKGMKKDISVTDYLNSTKDFKKYYKGYHAEVEYEFKETQLDPYFLGLWLGDGSSVKINIHNPENVIIDSLRSLNLLNNKHIPDNYLINSRAVRLKLLAGLLDSDGYLDKTKNTFELTFKSLELSKQTQMLARSLGFHCTVNLKKAYVWYKGLKKEGDYYRMHISGHLLGEIPTLVERKKALNLETKTDPTQTPIKVVPLDIGDYYGFEIDGNRRFLLEDYTVTHNTALALEILKNTSMEGVVSVMASLDMHRNRLYEKLLYKVSNDVYGTPLTRDQLYDIYKNDQEEKLLSELKRQFGNVFFYDRSRPTVSDVSQFVKTVEKQTGKKVKLILIDYFERISSDITDPTASSLRVANELQDLINDLNVALVTLVQPNKQSLAGGPDAPILSYTAIKGSSFLYQSFRAIVSIWRPFFTPNTRQDDKFLEMAILKNDLGELDKFKFNWNGKTGTIFPMNHDDELYYSECMDRKRNSIEPNRDSGFNNPFVKKSY